MAGVIYLDPPGRRRAGDELALRTAFRAGRRTRRTMWASDEVVVLTQDHVGESGGQPGEQQKPVPSLARRHGVAFGRFFDAGPSRNGAAVSQRLLSDHQARGAAAFDELNGAWAAVIWDASTRRACFARDALGLQPLFVAPLRDRIVFSTDLRVVTSSGLCDARELGGPDPQAIAEFLHYMYVPPPLSLVENVRAVLPGHSLNVPESGAQVRFGTPRFVAGPEIPPASVEAVVAEQLPAFEDRLLQAVSDCVPATGRIALALSGGKDSSALAVACRDVCPGRVVAFNVGNANARYDETSDAALVSKTLGLPFQSYVPTGHDIAAGLRGFIDVQDQPIGDPAALPYFLAMQRLPDDCDVIFDGTGNDYYFGVPNTAKGKGRYASRLAVQRWVPSSMWPAVVGAMKRGPAWMRELSTHWERPIEETFVSWAGWSADELRALYGRPVSFAQTYLWSLMRSGDARDWLPLLTEVVCTVWEPQTAYRKAMQLGNALDRGVRFPFSDLRLARFVNALPLALKWHAGKNKVLLRAYMAKHLPTEILTKPKAPFVFDLNLIVNNAEHDWVGELQRHQLLEVLPEWSKTVIADTIARHHADPAVGEMEYRVYALALLADLLAANRMTDSVPRVLRKNAGL